MKVASRDIVFTVPRGSRPGTLSLGPKAEASLDAWSDTLAGAGVTKVVSMLSDEEVARFDLSEESRVLARRSIRFIHAPVLNYDTPDAIDFVTLVDRLSNALASGAHVHIHCSGGKGRAGTLTACVLTTEGATPEEAIARVRTARGMPVPDTTRQADFVTAFADR